MPDGAGRGRIAARPSGLANPGAIRAGPRSCEASKLLVHRADSRDAPRGAAEGEDFGLTLTVEP